MISTSKFDQVVRRDYFGRLESAYAMYRYEALLNSISKAPFCIWKKEKEKGISPTLFAWKSRQMINAEKKG